MSDASIGEHLARLNLALQSLESRTTPSTMPLDELGEVKRALDDLRLRVWALLKAPHDRDPASFEQRFRVRRASELCQRLTGDLRTGLINPEHPEFANLWIAAVDLGQAIQMARGPREPKP